MTEIISAPMTPIENPVARAMSAWAEYFSAVDSVTAEERAEFLKTAKLFNDMSVCMGYVYCPPQEVTK